MLQVEPNDSFAPNELLFLVEVIGVATFDVIANISMSILVEETFTPISLASLSYLIDHISPYVTSFYLASITF